MHFLGRPLVAIVIGAFAIFLLARIVGDADASAFANRLAQDAPAVIATAGGGGHVSCKPASTADRR